MVHGAPPKTLVIIPAYNEEGSIPAVIAGIRRAVAWADVVVINDASADRTAEAAADAGAIVLNMPYNVGIGAAVQTGYQFADRYGYEIVLRIDGDGQHPAADLNTLIEALTSQQTDLIIGSRYIEDRGYSGSAARRLGSLILARLISTITGCRITDPTSGFTAANRRTIQLCAQIYPHDYPEPEAIVILHRAGLRIGEIPVTMKPRSAGRSSITSLGSGYYMIKVILAILIDLVRPVPAISSH